MVAIDKISSLQKEENFSQIIRPKIFRNKFIVKKTPFMCSIRNLFVNFKIFLSFRLCHIFLFPWLLVLGPKQFVINRVRHVSDFGILYRRENIYLFLLNLNKYTLKIVLYSPWVLKSKNSTAKNQIGGLKIDNKKMLHK